MEGTRASKQQKACASAHEVYEPKRKAVVDADKSRHISQEPLDQPFGASPARPVFALTRRRLNFLWRACAVNGIDTQATETR